MASANATSYAGRYELMPDLLGGDFHQYLHDFDSEGQQAPAALRDTLLDAVDDNPNKVFLYFCSGTAPHIGVVHWITRYMPTLGLTTEWDGSVFAMTSDVGPGNQVAWVHFPTATAFARTAFIRVPTVECMVDWCWTAAPADSHLLGPFAEATTGTESLRTVSSPLCQRRTFLWSWGGAIGRPASFGSGWQQRYQPTTASSCALPC